MISIHISTKTEFRRFTTFTVTPLFEMAASIQALARLYPAEHHQSWLSQARTALKKERLEDEWNYFAPVFSEIVPDILSLPYLQRFVTIDQLFEHLVHLPSLEFIRSMLLCLRAENRRNKELIYPVELDLVKDPELVQSRFTLFISSYCHLVFEPLWPAIAPLLYSETERINACLHTHQLGSYLRSITDCILYDEKSGAIQIIKQAESGTSPIHSIVLHPSWFFNKATVFSIQSEKIHIIYSIPTRETMV